MPLVLIVLAIVMVIVAYQNTQGNLVTSLESDIPGFVPLGLGVAGLGAVGFIPKMQPIARGLVGLLIFIYVFRNWNAITSGILALEQLGGATPAPTSATDPASVYATSPAGSGSGAVTQQQISGTTTTGSGTNVAGLPTPAQALASFNPTQFLSSFESGFGGMGVNPA